MTPRRIVPLIALCSLAVLPAGAHAGTFGDPQVLSSSGVADDPQIGFRADGSSSVAWWDDHRDSGAVQQALAPAGSGTFGTPKTILPLSSYDSFPSVASDAQGRSVIAFYRRHAPYKRIRVATVDAAGNHSIPITLSPKGHSARSVPQIASDSAGDTIAAWTWFDGHSEVGQYAIRSSGKPFGPVMTLPHSVDAGGFAPVLAVSPGGQVAVGFEAGTSVYVARGTLANGLGAPELIGAHTLNYAFLSLAVGDDGRAIAAFANPDGGDKVALDVAIAEPGGMFGTAQTVADAGGGDDSGPAVAVTSDGTALLAFAGKGQLMTASSAPGQPLSAVAPLAPIGNYAVNPSLVDGPGGTAELTWTRDTTPPSGDGVYSVVMASRYSPSGGFGPPAALSAGDEEGLFPVSGIAPSGLTVVAWLHSLDGSGEGNIDAATATAG